MHTHLSIYIYICIYINIYTYCFTEQHNTCQTGGWKTCPQMLQISGPISAKSLGLCNWVMWLLAALNYKN